MVSVLNLKSYLNLNRILVRVLVLVLVVVVTLSILGLTACFYWPLVSYFWYTFAGG